MNLELHPIRPVSAEQVHIGGDQGVKESPLKSAKHLIAKPVLDGLNHDYQWGA